MNLLVARSMSASLSSFTDDVSEINKKEPENEFVDSMRPMMNSLSQSIDEVSEIDKKILVAVLIEKFPNTYQFCNQDLNKFILLLRKGVYPYEYMDSWEGFNEIEVPSKKDLYSKLNLKDITDEDYMYAQKITKSI